VHTFDFAKNKRKISIFASLLALLSAATITQANLQFGKLVGSIELSESQMYEMFDELEQAANDVADLDVSSGQKLTYFQQDISRISKKYKTKIAIAESAIKEISLLPWNSAHQKLKSSYLRHSEAWVEHLAERSLNPALRESNSVKTSWEQFCFQAAKSSPLLAFGRYDTRLTQICTKGSN